MVVDTLTAELERSYGLEELQGVSRDLLGVEPSLLGADFTLASFARALAEHCIRTEAVDALLDVMEQSRRPLPAELKTYRNGGRVLSERIPPGESVENWLLARELGIGPCATVYEAHHGDQTVHLRLVHRHVAQHRRAVERYLASVRAFSVLDLPSLVPVVQVPRQSDRVWIATLPVAGQPLSEQLKATGPKHLHELLPLFWAIAEVLASLHQSEHCHGAIHLGNVFAGERSGSNVPVWLADPGAHLLRPTLDLAGHRPEHAWLQACSPEQIGGEAPTPRSDVYAFGALFYTLVAGKPPHEGSAAQIVAGHLSHEPEPLSLIAANRGATTEVDTLMEACLAKRPSERPADGIELLEVLRRLWRASTRPPSWAGAERLADRLAELSARPWDEELASQLEASADLGADPLQLAQGFEGIAATLESSGDHQFERPIVKLLARAARLYDAAGATNQAERVYDALVARDPNDGDAAQALDALRRKLGKFEELIESLLARSEAATDPRRRGELMGKIGDVYANNLHDTDQAVVAYAQALCEDPSNDVHVQAVERVAGNSGAAWQEVISSIMTAAQSAPTIETKVALLTHLGRWYSDKAARPDHAAACFASALELEPAHEPALRGLASVYRRAQQWVELGQVLLRWADVAAPNAARDMRAEAAGIVVNQLGDARAARDLYRAVIAEDPGHEAAVKGLSQLLGNAGERAEALQLLEGRARVLSGDARLQLLCEIAEGYELDLGDLEPAERHLRAVLAENPRHLPALTALDRILSRKERYDELLANLQAQLELSATKRQKVSLLERIAAIHDEQFLDHERAANALIEVLDLDPGRAAAADELARHYRVLERWQELAELLSQQYKQAADDERKIDLGVKLGRVFEEQLASPDHAIRTYEAVLAIDPNRPAALEGIARLSASTGDLRDALAALEALAEKADTPDKKAEQYARAARLLEDQGDEDGAIMRYKWALDANPTDPRWRRQLRDLYKKIRNFAAAAELLDEELEQTQGERAKGALAGELALVCWRDLRDTERAQAAAKLALHCDPTNTDALRVVGNLAFQAGAFHEAGRRLEPVIADLNALGDAAADTLITYVEAMARSGAADKGLAAALANPALFVDRPEALLRLAELSSEHGDPQATLRLCQALLERHSETLTTYELATAKQRVGSAYLAMGRLDHAQMALEQAVDADETNADALTTLAEVYEKTNQHEAQIQTLYKKLNLVDSDEKVKMLLAISQIASTKLNNADYAAKSLLFALSERPNDRTILAKLVELYSAERDWPRLIRVITRLADVVDEPKHQAKYFHTAALIASRELKNDAEALELLDRAIQADSTCEPAVDLALQLYRARLDWEGLKRLLKLRAEQQALLDDKAPLLTTLAELCDVYGNKLGRVDQAIAVAESALEIAPEQPAWVEQLAKMYAADPVPHMEKALAHFAAWVRREPRRVVPYQLLRKVHTAARRADGAWLASQALVALNRADADELRFFERFRSQEPPDVRPMNQKDWLDFVMPTDSEPMLTALFALIQPSVVATRQVSIAESGLTEGHLLDPQSYPYGLVLAASQAAAVLSMQQPPFFQDPQRPGRLGFLTTDPPSVLFASGAFEEAMSATAASFIAGRHLAYYLPGLYLRQLLPNATSLKAHLFAALRLVKPTFPVAPDIESDVGGARDALKTLDATRRDHLSHLVNRLLASGAPLDLKRWTRSVDLAADRTGLILCDDLPTAVEVIRNGGDRPGAPTAAERLEALLAYAVSPEYLRIRVITGISIDG